MTYGHAGAAIARIGTADKTIVDTVAVGVGAGTPAFSPDGQFLYTANQGDTGIRGVVEVRTSDMTLTRTADCGERYISNLAVTPNGDYVVGATNYGLVYLDARTFTPADTVLPKGSGYVALHPNGDTLYLAQRRQLYVLGPKNR